MALDVTTPACLYYGKLSNAEADLGSAIPSDEDWVALFMEASNIDSSGRTFTVKFVPDGDTSGDQHLIGFGKDMTIDAKPKVLKAWGRWVLSASGKLRGNADAADKVILRIDGIKVKASA